MKTIFITGSTDGIGKLAARSLALQGHQIYIHGRNSDKVNLTIEEIKTSSNNENIFGVTADFSNLTEVKELAKIVHNTIDHIDVLINNAGVFKATAKNNNGLDLRFTVNYLAPFIFTNSIVSTLKKAAAPRVINLSSAAQSDVDLEALRGINEVSMQESYAQSKLALTMWSFQFAEKHKDIITLAVNPGSLLNTKMVKEAYGNHWSSADKGANILTELALSENVAQLSGSYFDNDRGNFSRAHNDTYDQQKIENLIRTTEELLTSII
jgi:NAD(P)-dependent dehydrogenase (short-subunit alcohol dehydrogenase family)